MATDYISREECIKDLREYEKTAFSGLTVIGCISRIKRIPAADVRPVVKGKWIVADYGEYQLLECDKCHSMMWNHEKETPNFCNNCGADMRTEPPEEENT